MKVLVFGARVVGSYYAARFHQAGHRVTVVARGLRLAQVRQHGIVLEEMETGKRSSYPVMAEELLVPGADYDLVLVAVRASQLSSALPALATNWRSPNVLFLGNNLAGPDAQVHALGAHRVLLGFPAVGGQRLGHVVRYVATSRGRVWPTTMGELDGSLSERLDMLVSLFQSAGLPAEICTQMDAWYKSHAALVLPLAMGLYMSGGDVRRMARTRDALVLTLRAIREGLKVLEALQVPILPARLRILAKLPEPLLVALARKRLSTDLAETALQAHANAARDEMGQLARGFAVLQERSGVETPSWDQLAAHLEPAVAALRDGEDKIEMDWVSTLGVLASFLLVIASAGLIRNHGARRRRERARPS